MRALTLTVVLLVLVSLSGVAAAAQTGAVGSNEPARDLIRLTIFDSGQFEILVRQAEVVALRTFVPLVEARLNRPLLEMEQGALARAMNRILGELLKRETMEEMLVNVYARNFTESEIQQLLRFYRTDVGTKWVRLSPAMALEASEHFRELFRRREPEIQAQIQAELIRIFPGLRPQEREGNLR